MKNKFLLMLILLSSGTAFSAAEQDAEKELSNGELMNYVGYGAIVLLLVVLVVAMLIVLRAVKAISHAMLGPDALKAEADKPKVSTVNKLLSLRPLSEEKDLIIEHEYDGIRELDNPTPAWFMFLFYGTIVIASGYMVFYHVLGIGQMQDEEYQTEMAIANKQKEEDGDHAGAKTASL